jgi:hypothetical protein
MSRVLLASSFLFCTAVFAQEGRISGAVADPSGATVPGAAVTITNTDNGQERSLVTDDHGHFTVPGLRPGSYSIRVQAPGFKTYSRSGITLATDQRLTLNAELALGATEETVRVEASASQVDIQSSTLSQVIDAQRMTEMPLNGRNAAKLTLLVAGAVSAPESGADTGSTKTFPGAVTISTNGSRQNQISYNLDGGTFMDTFTNVNQPFPFPDALQ